VDSVNLKGDSVLLLLLLLLLACFSIAMLKQVYVLPMLLSFLNVAPLIQQLVDGSLWIAVLTPSMKKIPIAKNLVKFGPVTFEILLLLCMGGDCREADICTVLVSARWQYHSQSVALKINNYLYSSVVSR